MDEESPHSSDTSTERHTRPWLRILLATGAGVLVWVALAMPSGPDEFGPAMVLRIPLEAAVIVLLSVVLPRRALRPVALVVGVLIGLAVLLKGLDIGFETFLGRPFDVVHDWYFLGPAVGVLADSAGRFWTTLAVIGAIALAIGVLVVMPFAMRAVTGLASAHRRRSAGVVVVLAVAWAGLTLGGVPGPDGVPAASASTSRLAWDTALQVNRDAHDHAAFAQAIASDSFARVPGTDLLTALRGKDVLLVFVESYGRAALTNPEISSIVEPALADGQRQLTTAEVGVRSGFLTSSTFGGASWLAHSTVQSGLWVDSQQRYKQLLGSDRLTLFGAFNRAGWRTVDDIPEMTGQWPEGQPFYGFDKLYTDNDLGYQGPAYGYAKMPDQYILSSFADRELTPGPRPPVMAEIDLLSSHVPWTAPPRLVPWSDVSDGSIFNGPDGASEPAATAAKQDVRTLYALTIAYSMRTLASFMATTTDPNLVILAIGDHQPHTSVSGVTTDRAVPAMFLTRDRQLLERISGWGWTPSLRPAIDAPVWPMNEIRNRFLTAFGPGT